MKKIFIVIDVVLADFGKKVNEINLDDTISMHFKKSPDEIEGVFRDLEPLKNAVTSVIKLHKSGKYDLFIATTAPWNNPSSFSDKRIWIEEHFGEIFKKKMVITHRKDLLIGDYLIDDRRFNGASEFRGKWIHFGSKAFPNWSSVLNYLNIID